MRKFLANVSNISLYHLSKHKLARFLFICVLGITAGASVHAQSTTTVRWWDHMGNIRWLYKQIHASYEQENPGVNIEQITMNPADMGQALQLAFRSGQAPDIHTLAGLGVPVSQLVEQGWFVPIGQHTDIEANPFVKDALLEGLTVFNGEIYSFPLFSSRYHNTLFWFNKDLLEQAGYDPEMSPVTWEEVRELARSIAEQGQGRTFGIILPLQFTERMAAHVTELAMTAGAPGTIDWRTGECAVASEPFVQAIEFLLSFDEDGSLHPASVSLDARQGRARWAAGESAIFTDGPWNMGALRENFPEVMDNVGVAQIAIPDANSSSFTYNGPSGGEFWVSSQSRNPEIAAQILEMLTSEAFYIGLAESMPRPPLDFSAIAKADVHPTYLRAINYFEDIVRLAPEPLVRNPNVAQVYVEMRAIHPNLGEIVQGAFSGGISNIQAALENYCASWTNERNRAIEIVQGKGVDVSLDDWIFSNWQPGEDFTAEDY